MVSLETTSSRVIAKIPMAKNKMFHLEVSIIERCAMVVSCDNKTRLCHLRYGYLNINGLKLLSRKEMALDYRNLIISVFVTDVFIGCLLYTSPSPRD